MDSIDDIRSWLSQMSEEDRQSLFEEFGIVTLTDSHCQRLLDQLRG